MNRIVFFVGLMLIISCNKSTHILQNSMFENKKIYKVNDHDGFMALVNGDKYNAYHGLDWTWSSIRRRCIAEMNNRNIIVWKTSEIGGYWNMIILDKPSSNKCIQEFSTTIRVTNNTLCLADNYDLTLAAQYKSNTIPSKRNPYEIKLKNGDYQVRIRQLIEYPNWEDEKISQEEYFKQLHFEIVLMPIKSSNMNNKIDRIFWFVPEE